MTFNYPHQRLLAINNEEEEFQFHVKRKPKGVSGVRSGGKKLIKLMKLFCRFLRRRIASVISHYTQISSFGNCQACQESSYKKCQLNDSQTSKLNVNMALKIYCLIIEKSTESGTAFIN